MTTLAVMKTRIADELMRSDLTSQIASAIDEAITFYQKQRFYWNELDNVTWNTVADQTEYVTADEPYIPIAYDVDDMFILIGINEYRVKRIDPTRWRLLKNSSTKGQPFQYAYFNRTVYLYPTPTQVYEMRLVGHFKIDAPASDDEADNPWMTDAADLIRHRAKMILYRDVILDEKQAAICSQAETEQLVMQRALSSSMDRTGQIEPMAF